MTPLSILRKVRRVLGDKRYFCQGAYALSAGADPDDPDWALYTVNPHDRRARQWCLVGGLLRACSKGPKDVFEMDVRPGPIAQEEAIAALYAALPSKFKFDPPFVTAACQVHDLSNYSEEMGHKAVVQLLDKAIAKLEKAE